VYVLELNVKENNMTTSINTSNILPITQSTLDELEAYDQMVDDMASDMVIAGSSIWDDYEVRQALESGDTDRAFALIDNLGTTDWM